MVSTVSYTEMRRNNGEYLEKEYRDVNMTSFTLL